ncbi:hypothetical protein [Paenibacillus silvisoli]|uniref:hypothetical protein n=1 Tax=Paenibacillus silvisoli TaxID=3110539 RepID=UPI002804235D|nr:hypothetical protein [Paenibacillus silvisoli]
MKSFTTFVDRTKLPDFAKDFKYISVGTSSSPFAVAYIGIKHFSDGLKFEYQKTGYRNIVERKGHFNVLTLLYDADRKPIAYYETLLIIPDK